MRKQQKRIECKDVSFSYAGKDAGEAAGVLNNLSFSLEEPGFHALFGPSGTGKTTLARLLAGTCAPEGQRGSLPEYTGQVLCQGFSRAAYSYNLERLPGWASVKNHLEKTIAQEKQPLLLELAQVFGIADYLGQHFAQLSLGQKNRVNLLRYLLQDFDFLILDESMANVDEQTRGKIILKIKALFPETFFLYISHNVLEVARYCHTVLVLRGSGRLPQTVTIAGQNMMHGREIERERFEANVLEIMNAC